MRPAKARVDRQSDMLQFQLRVLAEPEDFHVLLLCQLQNTAQRLAFGIRCLRHDEHAHAHLLKQAQNAVGVILMRMREHQHIDRTAPDRPQILRGGVSRVRHRAVAAAVHQNGIVSGEERDALPLPHVERRHARDGRRAPRREQHNGAKRADAAANRQHRAVFPAFREPVGHGKQHIYKHQPQHDQRIFCRQRRARQTGEQLCRAEHIPQRPCHRPRKRLSGERPDKPRSRRKIAAHEAHRQHPQHQQIRQRRDERHAAEVKRGERHGKRHRANGGRGRCQNELHGRARKFAKFPLRWQEAGR